MTDKNSAMLSHGLITRNMAAYNNRGSERTVIVLGIQRGGTSMVAEILANLGVYMGKAVQPTYEDSDFSQQLPRYMRFLQSGKSIAPAIDSMLATARERDSQYSLWGFKFPDIICPELYERLRNPVFINIYRDPIAICARLQKSNDARIETVMPTILALQKQQSDFLLSTSYPCLALSYEKALLNPERCVNSIAGFLGLNIKEDDRLKASEKMCPPLQFILITLAVTASSAIWII